MPGSIQQSNQAVAMANGGCSTVFLTGIPEHDFKNMSFALYVIMFSYSSLSQLFLDLGKLFDNPRVIQMMIRIRPKYYSNEQSMKIFLIILL